MTERYAVAQGAGRVHRQRRGAADRYDKSEREEGIAFLRRPLPSGVGGGECMAAGGEGVGKNQC